MTTTVPTAGDEESLVERLREACNGHPHAKIAWPHRILHEAADLITRLRQERDEAQLSASLFEGLSHELDDALSASNAEAERLREALRQQQEMTEVSVFVPWLRTWCKARFGKWITHNTAKGALEDLRALQGSAKQ